MLSRQEIDHIEEMARGVLENAYGSFDAVRAPVNINKVVESQGLKTKVGTFSDPDIVGAYDKANATIYVSKSDTYQRQAFTVAHELGHFSLHSTKEKETFYRSDMAKLGKEDLREEREANWFAASLLMPRQLVETTWPIMQDVNEMAELFRVSYSAMRYRLMNLGLL
jgi:Zn-dependent peptidase ImmA (M78 family)